MFFLKKTKNYKFTTTTLPAIIIKLYKKIQLYHSFTVEESFLLVYVLVM
jgi:hypothetical protein